jgi:putative colanic acid biosynthesis UDP-glucose lipid carrier transferase
MKRLFDLALACLASAVLALPIVFLALLVKLTSPGPVLYWSERVGRDNRLFRMPKFRSMRTDTPQLATHLLENPAAWLTPLGAFLRRTSLDELPQFFNVLQGQMSIVGPRPHAVAHNEQYRQLIKAYMVRHKVKPGITGWAQIHGHRGETDTIEKMQARVEYDLEYLRNWTLGLDLQIIARTVKLVFIDRHAY